MAKKKKKPNKTERRETRLRKARQWVLTYTGSHIVRAYRKRFKVDYSCALKDLSEVGALEPERLALLQHHEQIRLEQKREEREARREQEIYDRFPASDDRFMFIAGYTSGGAPYGTTWEEMGLEPYQSLEDIPARKPTKPHPLKHVLFSELEDSEKSEIKGRLIELIDGFFSGADYIPDDEDRDEILNELCEGISDILNPWEDEPCYGAYSDPLFDDEDEDEEVEEEPEPLRILIADDSLKAVFDEFVAEIVDELKQDGIELPTFMDTLFIAETERLKIRRFYKTDLLPLYAIMRKPEVMYAWAGRAEKAPALLAQASREQGFHKGEVRRWLNRQYTRYHKDGYGYFAVTLKNSGKLIGQAGLMKLELDGEKVVELGYILDNNYWGQGYAIEAARACVDLAFNDFKMDKLYATIRPENTASVKLAVKLGMRKVGEITKSYKNKDMPHDIYLLEKSAGVE